MLCQFAGEVIARALGLSLPGPVIGLILLFVA
ncbi:MAG: CidA/LrgA family protein, partial [Janthinobacterium lividum]